jgi:hypothetical protein
MAAFTPEQSQEILQKINQKLGGPPTCPMCHHNVWQLSDGIVLLTLQSPASGGIQLGGKSLPGVPLICSTCGNTVLLNVFMLGVAEKLGILPSAPEGSK